MYKTVQAKAAILNGSVFEWWFEKRTVRNPKFETFRFRMDSEFECSEFEPRLYSRYLVTGQLVTSGN